MRLSRLYFYLIFLAFPWMANAQIIRISENKDTYISEIQGILAYENNAVAIKLGKNIEQHWQNKLSDSQKSILMKISSKMALKGHKMLQFYSFLNILEKCLTQEKFSDSQIDNFLNSTLKAAENYDSKTLSRMYDAVNLFLDKRGLFYSNYNRLYALGGKFSFVFEENIPNSESKNTIQNSNTNDKSSVFDGWDEPSSASTAVSPIPAGNIVKALVSGGYGLLLENTNLAFATASDSVFVRNTRGIVSLKDGLFIGENGMFSFENISLPNTFVQLKHFQFEIKNPKFSAEQVLLHYPEKLPKPIEGFFEFKSEKRSKNTLSSYPRFISYQNDILIDNFNNGILYKGGFSMMGKRIFSSSINKQNAFISVQKNGKTMFKTQSLRFELSDSLISAKDASFTAFIDKDSLYHPSIKLTYHTSKSFLKLSKNDGGLYKDYSYTDTYHRLFIKTDVVSWDLNREKIDFNIVSAKNQVPAVFESFDFFDSQRVTGMTGGAGLNPLLIVGNFTSKTNKNSFYLDEIANFNKIPAQNLLGGLQVATQQGYLDISNDNQYILTRKGVHYLNAFAGKKDFDDLIIPSVYGNSKDSTANATLHLIDKTLIIRGVRRFNISDSLRVFVIPYDRTIKVYKNRNISFDGQLKAKNYRFSGKNILFDYEKFLVNLNTIDSIGFTPIASFQKGNRKELGNHIRYTNAGQLQLNQADNKSGKVFLAQYPKLKIDNGVIVYFDETSRGKIKYDKNIRFVVPKIDFDSLSVQDLTFEGTFFSDNIFKPFKETLRAMPDSSIGFSHKVPGGKYSVLGNETNISFNNSLVMDGQGLHSEGKINHLAANLDANYILFLKDSLLASGKSGKINESVIKNIFFPQVEINEFALKLFPKRDSLVIQSKTQFSLYKASSNLSGNLIVRNSGLFGNGKILRIDSETSSETFKFNKEGFLANEATIKIKSPNPSSKPVLLGRNVDLNFNLINNLVAISTRKASISDSLANLEFPYAAYRTNIDKAEWDINNRKINMKGDVRHSLFAAINPEQEGLIFAGNLASYDIEQMNLTIGGVPFIHSADAKIIPDKGLVSIKRDALMSPLKNAKLVIDTLNGYHRLNNGNIQIHSKKVFTGEANYRFGNVRKDTFNIKMGKFELVDFEANNKNSKKPQWVTTATASVKERDSLFLSPKMLYQGEITMLAPNKNLSLNGFVVPILKKYPKLGGYWIHYQGDKSEEVSINVDKNLSSNDDLLFAGLHFKSSAGANGIYPTFLSPKESPDDQDIFLATGVFKRDESQKLFRIKTDNDIRNTFGKYELIEDSGLINLEGKFNLFDSYLAKYIQTAGLGKIKLDSSTHEFKTMMLVNFPIAQPILAKMAEKIVKTNLDLGINDAAIQANSSEFLSKLNQFTDAKDIDIFRAKTAKEHLALPKLSPKFIQSLVFSELNLIWSPKQNSFRSTGKLGISNIGETDINAQVNGYVEIRKNSIDGDEMYIFIELSPENWYYWGYKAGELGITSSDDGFNAMIGAKNGKSKDYQVIPVDFAEAMVFRKTFLETYLGVKEKPKSANKVLNPTSKKLSEVNPEAVKKEEKKKKTEDEKDGF